MHNDTYSAPAVKARETDGRTDAFGYVAGITVANNNAATKGIVGIEYSVGSQRFRKLNMQHTSNLSQHWSRLS